MIIKDLIELCPVEEIVSEILLMCGVDESEREEISRNHTAFINNLKKKTPIDTGYVVLGITYMDEGKEYLDASLFEKCELQEFFKLQNPVPDRSSVDTLTLEEIMQLLSQLRVPQNYGFELSPWEEILGYEVDPQNVTKVGAAKLSAAVIYDMTFWGFTEEEVLAERKKLEDTSADIERIRTLPAEEQKKYFKTANEIFPELKLEDNRTEAQKEQERLESAKEMLKNRLRTLEALKAYRQSCISSIR